MSSAAASSSSSVALGGSADDAAERDDRRDLGEPRLAREASRVDRGDKRVAIRLASKAAIEPLEPPSSGEQQRRRVAGTSLHRRHPAPQHAEAGAVDLVEGPDLRNGGQTQRVLGRPGKVLRLRCS